MNNESIKTNSFLSFRLGEEIFAANVSQVLNILEMVKITEVPRTPDYMKGIINLRGEVLPVIDTSVKFGIEATEITKNTCILVIEVGKDGNAMKVGAIVDSVLEVLEINEKDIKPAPQIGDQKRYDFITGIFKKEEDFIIILNLDKVFNLEEKYELDKTTEAVENVLTA